MAEKCGAKTRTGAACRGHAMPNGRCRMHGGGSPGQKNNRHAAKPGSPYSRFMTPEEQALHDELELGQVDHELRLTRIRLMRALQAETDTPELEEIVERDGAEKVTAKREERYKRRDYSGLIDRLTGRIESLERRRLELLLMQQQIDEGGNGGERGEVVGFDVLPYDDADQA